MTDLFSRHHFMILECFCLPSNKLLAFYIPFWFLLQSEEIIDVVSVPIDLPVLDIHGYL